MKTPISLWMVLFAAPSLVRSADRPPPAPAAASAPQPYTLFMGADFALQRDDGMFRVLNVVGSSFVIRVRNKVVHVHSGAIPVSIEIKRALKMTPGSAQLDGFRWERDYMVGTNPEEKAATAYANLTGEMQDELVGDDRTQEHGLWGEINPLSSGVVPQFLPPPPALPGQAGIPNYTTSMAPNGGNPIGSGKVAELQQQLAVEQSGAINASPLSLQEDTFTTNAYNHAQQDAARADGRNALHITFALRSPLRLAKPYAMFVALIHAPKHEHRKQQWIGGTEIDPVVPGRATTVDFFEGGFPSGFQVDRLAVYVFDDGGREIGTNLSRDRVGLSRDQAFTYLVIEYMEEHRRSTLPATPAMTKLPADWGAHVKDSWFRQTCYVKVDKRGHAEGIFTDPDCRQPANAYLSAMIMGVWFRPALDRGQPVETVTQVVPRTLVE